MTTIRIRKKAGFVIGFEVSGHSGYADAGEDIVCAAITSAVRYTETILNDVLKLDIRFRTDPKTALISFGQPDRSPADEKFSAYRAVLDGFALYMKQLSAEYSDYIQVLEV